jgi:hypothetical protein
LKRKRESSVGVESSDGQGQEGLSEGDGDLSGSGEEEGSSSSGDEETEEEEEPRSSSKRLPQQPDR